MQRRRLKIKLVKIKNINSHERVKIANFIEQHSLMDMHYVFSELFSYDDRELLSVVDENEDIKFVISIYTVIEKKRTLVYWGDMIKKSHCKSINLSFVFSYYLYKKEGLTRLFFREKCFVSICYNPRSFKLIPGFLNRYSMYDNNFEHIDFSDVLQMLGLYAKMQSGFYYDEAIKNNIKLRVEKRYSSNNEKLNQYFKENVWGSDREKNFFYGGRSLVVLSHYNKKLVFKLFYLTIKSIVDQLFKHKKRIHG